MSQGEAMADGQRWGAHDHVARMKRDQETTKTKGKSPASVDAYRPGDPSYLVRR